MSDAYKRAELDVESLTENLKAAKVSGGTGSLNRCPR